VTATGEPGLSGLMKVSIVALEPELLKMKIIEIPMIINIFSR